MILIDSIWCIVLSLMRGWHQKEKYLNNQRKILERENNWNKYKKADEKEMKTN